MKLKDGKAGVKSGIQLRNEQAAPTQQAPPPQPSSPRLLSSLPPTSRLFMADKSFLWPPCFSKKYINLDKYGISKTRQCFWSSLKHPFMETVGTTLITNF